MGMPVKSPRNYPILAREVATPRSPVASARPRSARHTRSGVSGRSMCRTPRWESASTTAFCTAGVDPIVADSPIPFAPKGFRSVGVSVFDASNAGRSAALGIWYVASVDVTGLPLSSYRTSSNNACAIPCPSPPCCCPRTSTGLRMRPQSSTATWRSSRTAPVAVSTSTTATCAPNGNVDPRCRKRPSAWIAPSSVATTTSLQLTLRSGAPATANPPSTRSTSSASTSSIAAAVRRPVSTTASACS